MAIKFDFNKMRTAVIGWLGGTDSSGASLSAGEQAVYVPKMRQGFQVETVNTARTLTAEDSGKIFLMNDSSGGVYEITLPTAIIAGPLKDAGGDVGAGTAGTEVSNLVIGTSSEIGDNIEIVFVGGYYVIMSGGSSISGAITTS